ncbi:ethanolamine ammonia-lyase light chain EutC, partial [Methylobacterium sp. J-067]|uniref:ethanolamine ammonia-lyase light chain EutC n=1 Tax=Methylobacterium sp. J-067 TaxID=2836648 RepID=UPI0028BEFFA6
MARGDPVGARLKARAVVFLIGERPCPSASHRLRCYVPFAPHPRLPAYRPSCTSTYLRYGLHTAESPA